MAAGERLIGSNIKLAGYLKLQDNPIYLGLSDNAYITTNISDNSIDIINLTGDINITSDNIFLNTNIMTVSGLFKYSSDLSLSYDNRTIVDKGYVNTYVTNYVDTAINNIGVSYWDLETSGELILNLGVTGPVIPHTTNNIDFGSTSYKWKNIFLEGYINKVNVNNAYTLPITDGLNGQILKTNGSGTVTWQNDIGGSGTLSGLSDVIFVSGTPTTNDVLSYNGSNWEAKEIPVSITVSAASKSINNSNQYLETDGTGIYSTPYVLPDNCILKYLTASCASISNWDAEVHVNGVLIPGAKVSIISSNKAYIKFNTIILFNAGDEVQLYVNGNNIDRPRISAIFVTNV